MATSSQGFLPSMLYRLTNPPIDSDNVEENLRMRLISALFLFQVLISLAIIIFFVPLQIDSIALSATVSFGILSLLCYGVSRTRFYNLSVFIYIVLMVSALFALFIANSNNPETIPEYSLSYLSGVLFLTSLFLSIRMTVVIAIINLIGIALLPLVVETLFYPLHHVWLFTLVTSILIIITVMIRRDVFRRLAESENRSRNLMAAYLDAVAIFSDSRGILAINPAFTDLLGYTLDDVLYTSIVNLAHDEKSRLIVEKQHQFNHKSAPFEVQVCHKNGEIIVVEIISQPYSYDNQPAHVMVVRDIRKYKEVLRQQHAQEIRYQSLLDLTHDAVFISDFEGVYIAVNQQAADILGVTQEALVGKTINDFLPQVYHTAGKRIVERLLADEAVPMHERTFIRQNGHRFPAEVTVRLLRDLDDNPEYIYSVVRDISERKKAEDQRLELALERERMSTLQQFLKDASHYFRTPLTSLKTSQYLLTQIRNNPEKQVHFLNVMKLEVARLERLISDMMMSTQLERDAGDGITFGRLDVGLVLPEIIQTFTPSEKRPAYATIEVDPNIAMKQMYVMASQSKFTTAIYRVLENAITYSPPDSVVTIRAYQLDQTVCIEIKDEGIGISEDEMPIIFQRFRRADRAVEMEHVGNGLGLFIAKKIVEMHYGEIKVQSEAGQGSTFTICLPVALRPPINPKLKSTQQVK